MPLYYCILDYDTVGPREKLGRQAREVRHVIYDDL